MALGRALAESGHYAESENAIKEAFRLSPRKAALAEAERAIRDGRLEDAGTHAERITRKRPARITKGLSFFWRQVIEDKGNPVFGAAVHHAGVNLQYS
jgi:Flp pilus assembly protein TadD